jgi:hypothetical protein
MANHGRGDLPSPGGTNRTMTSSCWKILTATSSAWFRSRLTHYRQIAYLARTSPHAIICRVQAPITGACRVLEEHRPWNA